MKNLNFKIVKKTEEIPSQDWDRVFPRDVVENYGYYKTLDDSNISPFSFYYAVIRSNERIVCIAPFFTLDFSFDTTVKGFLKKFILGTQKILPRFCKLRVLFFGSPLTDEFSIGIDKNYEREKILEFLIKEVCGFAKENNISTVSFYNLTSRNNKDILNFLKNKGFAPMESFPLARLEIKARSLEEYIQGLGANTRKDIRRKLRKAYGSAEIKTEVRGDLDGLLDRAYQLYLNNYNASGITFEKLTPQFFSKISQNMNGAVKYFITRVNDKVAAVNLCLVKDEWCYDKIIGFDYDLVRKYNLYFTTWCHNIDWCIKNGIRYYQPSQTDYDPKVRLGSKLIPLYVYGKMLNPISHFIISPFLKFIEPKRFDPILRNPTKYAQE